MRTHHSAPPPCSSVPKLSPVWPGGSFGTPVNGDVGSLLLATILEDISVSRWCPNQTISGAQYRSISESNVPSRNVLAGYLAVDLVPSFASFLNSHTGTKLRASRIPPSQAPTVQPSPTAATATAVCDIFRWSRLLALLVGNYAAHKPGSQRSLRDEEFKIPMLTPHP